MKNTIRHILFLLALCVQVQAINYPTYHGSAPQRFTYSNNVVVPLANQQRSSVGHVQIRSVNAHALEQGGYVGGGQSIYTSSSQTISSVGSGSTSAVASVSVGGMRTSTMSSGAGVSVGSLPHFNSLTKGSTFATTQSPSVVTSDYQVESYKGSDFIPPPGLKDLNGDGKVDEEDLKIFLGYQLPIGNAWLFVLALCIGYIYRIKSIRQTEIK